MSAVTRANPGTLVRWIDRSTGQSKVGKALRFSSDSLLAIHKFQRWDNQKGKYVYVGQSYWVVPYKDIVETLNRDPGKNTIPVEGSRF